VDLAAGTVPLPRQQVASLFPPQLGYDEQFWAVGPFSLLEQRALGDGSYQHNGGFFYATGGRADRYGDSCGIPRRRQLLPAPRGRSRRCPAVGTDRSGRPVRQPVRHPSADRARALTVELDVVHRRADGWSWSRSPTGRRGQQVRLLGPALRSGRACLRCLGTCPAAQASTAAQRRLATSGLAPALCRASAQHQADNSCANDLTAVRAERDTPIALPTISVVVVPHCAHAEADSRPWSPK